MFSLSVGAQCLMFLSEVTCVDGEVQFEHDLPEGLLIELLSNLCNASVEVACTFLNISGCNVVSKWKLQSI